MCRNFINIDFKASKNEFRRRQEIIDGTCNTLAGAVPCTIDAFTGG